jgi:hypothetical protein
VFGFVGTRSRSWKGTFACLGASALVCLAVGIPAPRADSPTGQQATIDPEHSLRQYNPAANQLPVDLHEGPFAGILEAGIDPLLANPPKLSEREFQDLVEFVRNGLFDEKVLGFCGRVPSSVPSGMTLQTFEGCP